MIPRFTNRLLLGMALALAAFGARAEDAKAFPVSRLPAPGGEVVFANPDEREIMFDQLHYAAARRAGDFVYLSGVEAGPLKGEGTDPAAFKIQLRRAFAAIKASLAATGADMSQVVEMETFHNCKTPSFKGDFNAQLQAMVEVKVEFFKPPYSTWTALCIDRHYSDSTVVEIKVTAYAPKPRP
jgi:enamine deaminase RidA (YjgF/YER057c/UK114 family)